MRHGAITHAITDRDLSNLTKKNMLALGIKPGLLPYEGDALTTKLLQVILIILNFMNFLKK